MEKIKLVKTTTEILSPLQLRDYHVLDFHLNVNDKFKKIKQNSLKENILFDYSFQKHQSKDNWFRIILYIETNTTNVIRQKTPYSIKLSIGGIFELEASFPDELKKKILLPNGIAMTYSIARGMVAEVTSASINGKYILPTINFIEVIKRKLNKRGEPIITTFK